jgi:hypothetical protein
LDTYPTAAPPGRGLCLSLHQLLVEIVVHGLGERALHSDYALSWTKTSSWISIPLAERTINEYLDATPVKARKSGQPAASRAFAEPAPVRAAAPLRRTAMTTGIAGGPILGTSSMLCTIASRFG